jgi:hypothetical protein
VCVVCVCVCVCLLCVCVCVLCVCFCVRESDKLINIFFGPDGGVTRTTVESRGGGGGTIRARRGLGSADMLKV